MKTCPVNSGRLRWMFWMRATHLLPSLAYAGVGVDQTRGFAQCPESACPLPDAARGSTTACT